MEPDRDRLDQGLRTGRQPRCLQAFPYATIWDGVAICGNGTHFGVSRFLPSAHHEVI